MTAWEIREATAHDAMVIGEFQTIAWNQTYRGLVPDNYLDNTTTAQRAVRWRQRITSNQRQVLIALSGGTVVGVASTSTTRERSDLPELELASIYLIRTAQGSGLAHDLLHTAIGDDDAHLWMFTTNTRASRFYTKHGFHPTDEHQIDPGTGLDETRWIRRRP